MNNTFDVGDLDETNILKRKLDDKRLSLSLSELGISTQLIDLYLSTRDTSVLFSHSQDPEFREKLDELILSCTVYVMESSKSYVGDINVSQNNPALSRGRNKNEPIQRRKDLIQCSEEVKHQYLACRNTLKLPLLPSSEPEIHGVEDLHVPVVLKEMEISPDLPKITNIHANDVFKRSNKPTPKTKILLYGLPGAGKSTEIKMWLYHWCHNMEGPLKHFPLVFYIDGAKLKPTITLGEAVYKQCLSADSKFSPEDIEIMCKECESDVLVILDNYNKWRKKGRTDDSSSLERMILLQDFTSLTLLVATTSCGVGDFRDVYGNYDHVKVEGISEGSVHTYVQQVFKNRVEFGRKVQKCLKDTHLISHMAASPVLLSIMCQIVKWYKNPEMFGDLKTGSALIDQFIDCIIRHAGENPTSQVRRCSEQLSRTHIDENADQKEEDKDELSAANALRGPLSSARKPKRRNQLHSSGQSLPTEETMKQLSAVAFRCYLKEDQLEQLHLSEDDIEVCGDLKQDVIEEGCRLGILVKSYVEEFNPSSLEAAKGKVISFLNAPIQQRLAAKHFAKLLQGNDDEKQSFHTSIGKIGSIDDAISLRNLLMFTCEESVDSARQVISHVVDLTPVLDPNMDDGVLTQDHGVYQYMIEFILDLNYAAKSKGRLNDILRPLVARLRILSPTAIMTRALAYLLEHSFKRNTPKLEGVEIEVFDDHDSRMESLPQLKHIHYTEERAQVEIEDPSAYGGASSASEPLRSNLKRKLSIKIPLKKSKAVPVIAPKFSPPSETKLQDNPFTEIEAIPFKADELRQDSVNDGSLPVTVSAGHKRGVVSDGRARRDIPEIDQNSYEVHDFIAEGSFGEVYKATWKGKEYALKRIKNIAKGRVEIFKRELRMNALVSHRNIVVLHAYATCSPPQGYHRFDLIMDYIEGPILELAIFGEEKQRVKYLETRKGKMDLAFKVCDAICHMHANGCTHSDIKPNNIMIKLPENEPFVCDLGSGHVIGQSTMTSGKRHGVQRCSPPESSRQGFKASFEGDIWSLACILVEVFTRRQIWEDCQEDERQLITRLMKDDVVPELLSDIKDKAIKNILQRCFTKNTKDRPRASDLVNTFQYCSPSSSSLTKGMGDPRTL